MNNKNIILKDGNIEKKFIINKLFANDALKFINLLTDISPDDEESIKSTKRFIDYVVENGSLPENSSNELANWDYIDILLQLVKKRYTKEDNFIEILLKNSVYLNGEISIGNITLFNNKNEANNINNIIITVPCLYKFIKEHLILNYKDFFLLHTKD